MAGVAEAGEIRVSDEVRLAALDDAESSFSNPRVVVLKGFEDEELTHALDWGWKEN